MLETWIIYTIGKRYYLLNKDTFDFNTFSKKMVDISEPLIKTIKGAFSNVDNYIKIEYDDPLKVYWFS